MYVNKRGGYRGVLVSCLFFALCLLALPFFLYAQGSDTLPIAHTISVADPEVAYGDIVLFDPDTSLYRRSEVANDPRVFGVVVEDPTLLIETDTNLVPVAESGTLPVNVSLENGAIEAGDAITTSRTAGKGMRASDGHENIIGFALQDLSENEGVAVELGDGSEVLLGTVLVEVGGRRLRDGSVVSAHDETARVFDPNTGKVVARFGFAAIVALASIGLTFAAFLSSVRQSVISVGRNPLAKSSIRSMVVLNIVLALIVTAVGIFFAISLLVVPL